jgi:hypothetical protein
MTLRFGVTGEVADSLARSRRYPTLGAVRPHQRVAKTSHRAPTPSVEGRGTVRPTARGWNPRVSVGASGIHLRFLREPEQTRRQTAGECGRSHIQPAPNQHFGRGQWPKGPDASTVDASGPFCFPLNAELDECADSPRLASASASAHAPAQTRRGPVQYDALRAGVPRRVGAPAESFTTRKTL